MGRRTALDRVRFPAGILQVHLLAHPCEFVTKLCFSTILLFATVCVTHTAIAQQSASFDALQRDWETTYQSSLNRYCVGCHSAAENQGELDLEQFHSIVSMRKNVGVWQRVLEMLHDGEMPPKDAKHQPTPAELNSLKRWVQSFLDTEALANAGDPGPVVLRRLNNAEYTYTIQDLTQVALQPAAEFPSDSAAGEGFTNVGSSLAMSPSLLQKYLGAAKEIASHTVLLPDRIRFSSSTTKQDWTNEKVASIQQFYSQYSDNRGAQSVNLQGIQFDTNGGGRLALESYLRATIVERDALMNRSTSVANVAKKYALNEKYLAALWSALTDPTPSILLDTVRSRWKSSSPEDLSELVTTISIWQNSLWRFTTIGHIGKRDGPTAWQVPVEPFAARQDLRIKLPKPQVGNELTMYLVASDLSDGNEHDFAVWENPRFVAPDKPDLLLRDLRRAEAYLAANRSKILESVMPSLHSAAEFLASKGSVSLESLAQKNSIDVKTLTAWFQFLGIARGQKPIDSYLLSKLERVSSFDFVKGWAAEDALSVLANPSDELVRVPGDMKPHSVGVHPSPKKRVAVGWKSPVNGTVKISGSVQRAHMGCGNGVTWTLELRQSGARRILASGVAANANLQKFSIEQELYVQAGDIASLIIGPRNGDHSCDMTAIDLTIQSTQDSQLEWNLANDVSSDILQSNPHSDRLGNAEVWHFYSEPDAGAEKGQVPVGSILDRWWNTGELEAKQELANQLDAILKSDGEGLAADAPDRLLLKQLTSLSGGLFSAVRSEFLAGQAEIGKVADSKFGLDASKFGVQPNGEKANNADLVVQAPTVIEFVVPTDLVEGYDFVANGSLHPTTGQEGTVQLQVLFDKPANPNGLSAGGLVVKGNKSTWSDGDKPVKMDSPILVGENSQARKRLASEIDAFRQLFPAALCYTKIVPVDEVVTLTLYFREDNHLKRLMLGEEQAAELDKLWEELYFISQEPLALVDAYEQLWQFATQDADPSAFTPMREGIMARAEQFKKNRAASEPLHVKSVLEFAEQAWRRPLSEVEKRQLADLYGQLRKQEIEHEAAIRVVLARVLVAPAFLYRGEKAVGGSVPGQVKSQELATRLSYFLWSTAPDSELRRLAADNRLQDDEVLRGQLHRMLKDERMRRMAIEFGCQWLHVRDFEHMDEKSERLFPEFAELKADMGEESIRFFEDMFRNDGSVLDLLDANYTFVNARLAKFYGISGVEGDWQRVDGTRRVSRGGILSMAATMAKQSGASRTSPILRGNWVSEFLLGEKLPRPPKNVPVLPEDVPQDLTERQLIERHSSDASCAKCHQRIDGFGFALEQYDTIGRLRTEDANGHKIDSTTSLRDGTKVDGIEGLRVYLSQTRQDDFLATFCRRLLGYSLGRSVQLSDKPLVDKMVKELKANGFKISIAMEQIVLSPQFRTIRSE